MSKKHFIIITYLISISLVGLITLQVLWLTQMYKGMNDEFAQKINSALDRAAYQELSTRISHDSKTPTVNLISHKKVPRKDTTIIEKSVHGSIVTTTISKNTLGLSMHTSSGSIDSSSYKHSTNIIATDVSKGGKGSEYFSILHFSINSDSSPSINLNLYDSLVSKNLRNSNIYSEYELAVVDLSKDSTLLTLGIKPENPLLFKIPLDSESKHICQLAIENPNISFLKEMSGIIISSILILSLVLFSFFYLLRTLFRQKTLEEMRNDFTHNITHELKTPIATAYAANDALINFSADKYPHKREQYLEIVNTQLLKLSNMVERILCVASQETLAINIDSRRYLVKDIFKEVVSSFDINSSINIHFDIIPSDLSIKGDYFHITNLLNNMVDNALKYSDKSVKIELVGRQEEDYTVLKIKDNGIGISPANQKRIFDKYYRVPTGNIHNVKGVGLGLYYAKLILERHQGSIRVESKLAEGSIFTIILPNSKTLGISK